MKLPWDTKYLKIAFHVIFTLVAVYVLVLLVNLLAYVFINIGEVTGSAGRGFKKMCDILLPVLIGLVIAYLLNPMADFFQKWTDCFYQEKVVKYVQRIGFVKKRETVRNYKKRTAGAVLSYLTMASLLGILLFVFSAGINNRTKASLLDDAISSFMMSVNGFEELVASLEVMLLEWGMADYFSETLASFMTAFSDLLATGANRMVSVFSSFGNGILNFLLGVVIGFYFIMEKNLIKDKIIAFMDWLIPHKQNKAVKQFFARANLIFSGYIQGQLTDACIVAVLISVWLSLVKIQFPVVIGLIAGISNIVPYVGAFVGFVLAILAAVLEGDLMKAVYAAVGVAVIQQADGMFIQPKVIGVNVKVSPVLVLVSLSIAGRLFGIAGMFLAVPACAVIKMVVEGLWEKRKTIRQPL